jgi:hypothetical protein
VQELFWAEARRHSGVVGAHKWCAVGAEEERVVWVKYHRNGGVVGRGVEVHRNRLVAEKCGAVEEEHMSCGWVEKLA